MFPQMFISKFFIYQLVVYRIRCSTFSSFSVCSLSSVCSWVMVVGRGGEGCFRKQCFHGTSITSAPTPPAGYPIQQTSHSISLPDANIEIQRSHAAGVFWGDIVADSSLPSIPKPRTKVKLEASGETAWPARSDLLWAARYAFYQYPKPP